MTVNQEYEAVFNPCIWQSKTLLDLEKEDPNIIVHLTSRQIGKTTLIKTLIYKYALEKPNTEIVYLATTISQSNELMFKKLIDSNPPLFDLSLVDRRDRQHRIVQLKNGSKIICGSRENISTYRGLSCDICIIDEAQLFDESCLEVVLPLISAKSGKLFMFGTCQSEYDFLYQSYLKGRYESRTGNKDWYVRKIPITSKECLGLPTASEKNINLQKSVLSESAFNSEWMCEPTTTKGAVYPQFSMELNTKEVKIDERLPLLVGFDFNVDAMSCVCVQRTANDEVYIVDEIVQDFKNSNTHSLCKELKAKYGNHRGGIIVVPDASGRNRDSGRDPNSTNHQIIRSYGLPIKFDHRGNPPILDSTIVVNGRILNAHGERKLFVHPKCKHAIESFNKLAWDKNGQGHNKEQGIDHVSDAIRYVCWIIYKQTSSLYTQKFY